MVYFVIIYSNILKQLVFTRLRLRERDFIYEYNETYKVFQTLTPEARDPFAILSKPSARTQSAKP